MSVSPLMIDRFSIISKKGGKRLSTKQVNKTPMYVNGQWVGEELEQIEVVNPATHEIIAYVPKGGKAEARQAVDAAQDAFGEWAQKTADERSKLLMKWYRLIDEQKEEIGELMT